ncbi:MULTISPECIES: phosphotransferase family protein [Streptomyces]|uniref:Aminoglycoside phosphotransferase n=1 Tax=Streptomyces cheonanensis TaxID=312720 RepID=A0ABP5H2E8_9ACTN|nr:aminoglycoside phosphotransferase family protein [Streptomyces harbinensis]QKV71005.1 aminoglycoside phosphotransferase family protein [Streptomyces harbinensis]
MDGPHARRARAAALSIAASLGLPAAEAIVLHDSNKLTLRLLPCDVLARVAPEAEQVAHTEVELAQQLTAAGAPVAALDPRVPPRVYERDGWVVTFWTYYAPTAGTGVPPAGYARALERLHAGLRTLDVPAPHWTERVGRALHLLDDHDLTPALADRDRDLLTGTLRDLSRAIRAHGAPVQPLHGEPHPGNLLATRGGPLFIDLETVCTGPVEFDLAHAPEAVAAHYPGVDHALLRDCRTLVLAVVTTWRWDRDDRYPDGHRLGTEWLGRLRVAREGGGPDTGGA